MSRHRFLPLEIIEKILKYLKPSDRLVATTVCLSWYEASLTFSLWKDVVVTMENSLDEAAAICQFTRKPIQHVRIKDVNFSSSTPGIFAFWEQISHSLLSLEIHRSYVTESNLLNILLCCHSLESLHFHDCRDTFITGKLFSNALVLSHVKKAMPKLKSLGFSENNSYLSDALLDRFMTLVANLEYLSFSGTTVSFHPGINKKFYSENRTKVGSTSSELVLTFDCIMQHIANHSATVKYLDFSQTQIDDKACGSLSKIGDLKLHSLLLRSCEVGSTGINSLCATQSTLTELDISCCPRITDTALSSICSLLPNLQKLSLRNCHAVTDTGLSCISQLSGLKEINLQGLRNITSFGIEKGLFHKRNEVLREINLSMTRITEVALLHLAENSPFLTHLDLTSCTEAVSDSSLPVVCNLLLKLRDLRLDWCVSITDNGFREANVSTLLIPAVRDGPQNEWTPQKSSYSISNLRGLVYLSISGCNKITDQSLQEAFRFRDLRYLDLNACSLVTDSGLVALCEHNRGLETLILNYCKITDCAMITAISYLARIIKLSLHGCSNITKLTLQAIEKFKLRYLSHLDISHCVLISLEYAFQFQLRTSLRELGTVGLE
ncbi:hypothetical protein DAPPUDRAFT_99207 [Daphnia pulex]|uniref:F-box domain-containing protein n=1 Tax=Daphnia pulex TaxID=6669 RepID=E9G608_DAPPU|nr:hypothetical protein DAPPUDRAFT_99207 [Daphnia pulex]|eukprot:EFX84856.1 hypothetical protein DAPPUDRAFT_99207 [Daphnia pulex]